MIYLVPFIKLLHIVTGIMMIAGVIGRGITRAYAGRATSIHDFELLMRVSGPFENLLAIPGSILVFFFGIVLAWLQGWPLLGFLSGASSNWLLVSTLLYLAIYPLVIFIFIPRGKLFGAALAAALAQGEITLDLRAALDDAVVRAAHYIELILTAAIIYLMVVKPF